VRALVDMDLLDGIRGKLLVEIEGIISFVNLEFKILGFVLIVKLLVIRPLIVAKFVK